MILSNLNRKELLRLANPETDLEKALFKQLEEAEVDLIQLQSDVEKLEKNAANEDELEDLKDCVRAAIRDLENAL